MLLNLILNKYVLGAILAVALIGGAYWKGYSAASANCHEAAVRAELAAVQKDLSIAQDAATAAQIAQAELQATALETDRKVERYEDELAKRPATGCALDGSDVDSLRGILAPARP